MTKDLLLEKFRKEIEPLFKKVNFTTTTESAMRLSLEKIFLAADHAEYHARLFAVANQFDDLYGSDKKQIAAGIQELMKKSTLERINARVNHPEGGQLLPMGNRPKK